MEEIGSLVAVNHPQWVGTVPQIGKVKNCPRQGKETLKCHGWNPSKVANLYSKGP